jgi:hypothetical protein
MSAPTLFISRRVAGLAHSLRQGLIALPFFLFVTKPVFAQKSSQPPVETVTPVCRSLPLHLSPKTSTTEANNGLAKILDDFEMAFLLGDSEIFARTVSPALLKKKEEAQKIFEGTVLEYGLKKVKLQRNWLWDLQIGSSPEPGRLIDCGTLAIQPVYGPTQQYAVQYSTYSGTQQSRIFVLFGLIPDLKNSPKPKEQLRPGLVHMQVQRWTYDGRAPDRLLTEAQKTSSAGDPLVASLLAESAARILEINPYLRLPQLKDTRELANQFAENAKEQQRSLLQTEKSSTDWRPEKIVPVFRDSSLAVGIKIRMHKEMSLNEQRDRCLQTAHRVFTKTSPWRSSFSGVECMVYALNEDLNKPPSGGSQFFPWSRVDSGRNH